MIVGKLVEVQPKLGNGMADGPLIRARVLSVSAGLNALMVEIEAKKSGHDTWQHTLVGAEKLKVVNTRDCTVVAGGRLMPMTEYQAGDLYRRLGMPVPEGHTGEPTP